MTCAALASDVHRTHAVSGTVVVPSRALTRRSQSTAGAEGGGD